MWRRSRGPVGGVTMGGGENGVMTVTGAPLLVSPRLDGKPWGGRRLAEFGFALPPGERIGEALITAAEAVVSAGPLAGRTLGELALADPAGMCGARGLAVTGGRAVFPLLIKVIDAAANLSIQVHPDDAGAARRGPGLLGKTEAWVVLAAEPGAVIYAGFGPETTLEAFAAAVRAERGGTADLLRRLEARSGETYLLPAGTVHALGAGIVVYEVQQPSDITYRLDDWGRLDAAGNPRETHVDAGLATVDPSLIPAPIAPVGLLVDGGEREVLAACRYFATERVTAPAGGRVRFTAAETPQVLTCLRGGGAVASAGERVDLGSGGTVVVPAVAGSAELVATSPIVVLRSWLPELGADVIEPGRMAGARDEAIAALGGPSADVRDALVGIS